MSKEQQYAGLHYRHGNQCGMGMEHHVSAEKTAAYLAMGDFTGTHNTKRKRTVQINRDPDYTKDGNTVYQSKESWPIKWRKHKVYRQDIYGQYQGMAFVVEPYIQARTGFMPMNIRVDGHWKESCDEKIVNLICDAFRAKKITIYNYDKHLENLGKRCKRM
jgi:hypothetical protein